MCLCTCAHVLPDLSVHGGVCVGAVRVLRGWTCVHDARRGLHERGAAVRVPVLRVCVQGEGRAYVSVRVNTGTLRGLEAGCVGGSSLGGEASIPSRAGGGGGGCVWLSGHPAKQTWVTLPAPPSPGLAPPVPWHQSRQRRRSQNPLQAGGMRRHGWKEVATGMRPKECPALAHPALPAANPIQPPLGGRSRTRRPLTLPTLIPPSSSSSRPLICGHSERGA